MATAEDRRNNKAPWSQSMHKFTGNFIYSSFSKKKIFVTVRMKIFMESKQSAGKKEGI